MRSVSSWTDRPVVNSWHLVRSLRWALVKMESSVLFFLGHLLLSIFSGYSVAAERLSLRTKLAELQLPEPVSAKLPWGNASTFSGMVVPLKVKKGAVRSRSLLRTGLVNVEGAVREVGYFTAELRLGTPPREFSLIIDTGSTISYVPCSDCKRCGKHKDEPFDPKSSSTAVMLGCNAPKCKCGSPACTCVNNKCYYSRTYAERSSSEGYLLEDVYQFPDAPNTIAAGFTVPQVKLVFGCEQQETGEIYRQIADGILGMGNNNNAFQSQLVEQGVMDDTFALCFGYPDGGSMFLGDVPFAGQEKMIYTPLIPGWQTHYYTVKLEEITIDGTKVNVAPSVFAQGYGAVLDSGTTFTYLPTAAFNSFADLIDKAVKSKGLLKRPGADPQYNDICWKGAPSDVTKLSTVFPKVEMVFGEGAVLELRPLQYLFVLGGGSYCLGIFDNGGAGSLIGGITVRDVILQYDRRNQRAGFLPVESCSDIPLRQVDPTNTPAPAPTPDPADAAPTPAATPSDNPPPPSTENQPPASDTSRTPTPAVVATTSPPPPAATSSPSPTPQPGSGQAPSGGSTHNTTQAKSPPPPQSGKKPTGIIVTDELPRPVSTTSPMVAVVAVAVIGLSALAAYVYRREVWSWVGRMTSRFDAHDEQELVALKGGPEMGKDTLKISAASSSKV